jgi:hypothetical protein
LRPYGSIARRAYCHEWRKRSMSALGHKQTCAAQNGMSALPSKADVEFCRAKDINHCKDDGGAFLNFFRILARLFLVFSTSSPMGWGSSPYKSVSGSTGCRPSCVARRVVATAIVEFQRFNRTYHPAQHRPSAHRTLRKSLNVLEIIGFVISCSSCCRS